MPLGKFTAGLIVGIIAAGQARGENNNHALLANLPIGVGSSGGRAGASAVEAGGGGGAGGGQNGASSGVQPWEDTRPLMQQMQAYPATCSLIAIFLAVRRAPAAYNSIVPQTCWELLGAEC